MNGFFDKMRNGMARFMYGRNGADSLNWAIFALYVLSIFLQPLVAGLTTPVGILSFFNALSFALAAVYIFRAFSRNLEKRRAENAHFVNWWYPKKNAIRNWNLRRKDKTHSYVKCGHCGTWCRVPKGVGKIEITCPKCRTRTITKT